MINFPYGIQLWGIHLPFCIGCYNSLRGSKFSLVDANLYFDIDDLIFRIQLRAQRALVNIRCDFLGNVALEEWDLTCTEAAINNMRD